MKKILIASLILLSITNTPRAIGCTGWANGLVAMLRNTNGHCHDLETKEQQEQCYKFKQEYISMLDSLTVMADAKYKDPDFQVIFSSSYLTHPFKTLMKLKAALASDDKNVQTAAEDILAKIASYQAKNSSDQEFGRVDYLIISMTETGKSTPRCR